jgi:Asp/Glu/hydantoin racemase
MSGGSILVINPNSTQSVTSDLDRALHPLRFQEGPTIECLTLAEGPAAIETNEHIERVKAPLCRVIREREQSTSTFVIACFSDPGLEEARAATQKTVLGVARCGLLTALALGTKIGVISILEESVQRHQGLYAQIGITSRIAGDRAVGLGVLELADESAALPRLTEVGTTLRQSGAHALVLGCTGMTPYRSALEQALGLPVVDPTIAAVGMALGVAACAS